MPIDRDPLNPLVAQIYDAALGMGDWHAPLAEIARRLGGAAAVLSIVGPRSPARIVQVGFDPDCLARYVAHYAGRNEWAVRSAASPVGSVLTIDSVMPKAEFLRTAFYDDCLRPQGLHAILSLRAAHGRHGAVANVCVLRSERQGEFAAEDVDFFSRLAPDMRRAVALHLRLAEAEGERQALAGALEHLARIAFLVDAAATVQLANRAGAALLAARDGLRTDPGEDGALGATEPGETAALRRLIADAARPASGRAGRRAHLPVALLAAAAAGGHRDSAARHGFRLERPGAGGAGAAGPGGGIVMPGPHRRRLPCCAGPSG